MDRRTLSRRTVLRGSAAMAGLAMLRSHAPALAATRQAGRSNFAWPAQAALDFPVRPGEEVIPWLDQPAPNPVPDILGHPLHWEDLDSWITPNEQFFTVKHYYQPEIDPQAWRLEVHGLVQNPLSVSLADLQAREAHAVPFTLECSGNHGLPFLIGAVGNAVWTGTSLAALLEEAGVQPDGREVVFWGTDSGPQEVNGVEYTEQFARSMSIAEAMDPQNILCWGMNGVPLPAEHGGPVRLIAPGWFGIANVKWLARIEVLDRPYEGRFMAREYVTIRQEERDGETRARFTSVGYNLIKAVPAKVTRLDGQYRIIGVAYGAPIAQVEVKIDDGDWLPATIEERGETEHTWVVWSLEWGTPADGEYSITTRAIDTAGNIQPAPDDPSIANKLTFWESNGQVTRQIVIGLPTFSELPDAATLAADLSGGNEIPGPGDADGFGYARLVVDPAAGSVCYRISVSGIDAPTAAHIHSGASGASGPVVVPLMPVDGSGLWDGCVAVDAQLAAAIVTNYAGYYVNVHTSAYPAGAVRGQLGPIV